MTNIDFGMDISGNPGTDQFYYLGVVVGIHDRLKYLHKPVKHLSSHMTLVSGSSRRLVLDNLSFKAQTEIAFCIKLSRKDILERFTGKKRKNGKKITARRILDAYDWVVMQELQIMLTPFLCRYGISWSGMDVQCDNDCKLFSIAGGFRRVKPDIAYKFADYIA